MDTATTPRRSQFLWLPMGGLLGALSGALTGMGLLLLVTLVDLADPDVHHEGLGMSILFIVIAGGWFGGIAGLVVGLFVGVEMMFLVGVHLPRDIARRRAFLGGSLLTPLTMVALIALPAVLQGGLGRPEVHVGVPSLDDLWWLTPLAGGSVFGGHFARWMAGFRTPPPPVS